MTTHADLVFTGGPAFTTDPALGGANTVAVRGDRIVAVGGSEVRELIGPGTEVVDLAGRLLVPGFTDAHVHAVFAGVELGECDLTGTTDIKEYRSRIAAYAAAHPEREWITGGGWSMESFMRRCAHPAAHRRSRRGPPGTAVQPRPPRRLGQHPGPGTRRTHRGVQRPRRRPDRA